MTSYVYHLVDEFGNVRYVGKCRNPKTRLGQHNTFHKDTMGPVWEWVKFQQAIGRLSEIMVVIRSCEGDGRPEERREIRRQISLGAKLLNVQCVPGCKFRRRGLQYRYASHTPATYPS
jgi:hypothetical protein